MSSTKSQNNGEKGEKRVILELLLHKDNTNWLVSHFGDEAAEGIEVIDPANNQTITSMEQIKKAASSIKADIKIKFNSSRRVIGISIKYFHKSNPCIVNCTSRDKFIKNEKLKKYLPALDQVVGQYLKDPSNVAQCTSEVDRALSCYTLSEVEKRNVAAAIAYFTLDGTGKKDASVPANGVLDMYHRSGQMNYKECSTDDEKIDYVLSNWDRYVISIRGVKQQKNGKLRGNGMPTKKKVTDDQEPWVCYYYDKGVKRPRGAISIRIKK